MNHGPMIRRMRERLDGRRRGDDQGLTLVELLIAMVLAITLGGVIVAAIVTSLNVADATSDGLKSSVDIRLISAYLGRDAQGAAAVDPKTAKPAQGTGVSVTDGDWAGCTQDGKMVARFSWIEYLTVTDERSLTVTYALDGSELSRAICIDGTEDSTLLLGRSLSAASARCRPNPDCSGTPTEIEFTFSGTNNRSPYTTTLSASLRSRGQDEPTIDNSSIVSLLAMGDPASSAPCTNLSLASSKLYVVGDAVIANECGPTSIDPSPPNIEHLDGGTTSLTANLSDPLAAMPKPTFTCGTGSNPATIGVPEGDPTVYPQPVTIAAGETVSFAPGRYVFCKGLTVQADATVTSSATTPTDGVLLYIAADTLTIDPAASVELTAASTGPQQRIVIWASGSQTVDIGTGAHVTRLGGTVYAPNAKVQLSGGTGAAALNVGSIVAETIGVSGIPAVRVGPVLPLDINPLLLPDAEAGQAYTQQLELVGSGAAALVDPVWTATGLSPFSINSLTGEITGTAQCPVDLTPAIRVVDSNGVAVSREYTLKATAPLGLSDPGSYVRGTVTLTATLADICAGAGTSVSIQYALSGADDDENGEPDWATLCTQTAPVSAAQPDTYTCAWDTTASPFVSGDTYDLRAIATLPNGTSSESEMVEGVTVDNTAPVITLLRPAPTPLSGTVILSASASDGESGIQRVVFEYSIRSTNNWINLCTENQPDDPAVQDIYKCEWDTTQFAGATTIAYDIRAIAVDLASNVTSDTETNLPVNNSGASVSVSNPGTYVRGTVAITTNTYVPDPATPTAVTIEHRRSDASVWTTICVDVTDPFSCAWDTTQVTDGSYDLRATMNDSRNGDPAVSAVVTTFVDNNDFYAVDVKAVNGRHERKEIRGSDPKQYYAKPKVGKPDAWDTFTLKYSKPVDPASLIAGWDGAVRNIYVRLLDGRFVSSSSTAANEDLLDFCVPELSSAIQSSKGMNCSGTGGTGSDPKIGQGTGLGHVRLWSQFVDGWNNTPKDRKAGILFATIRVDGPNVIVRIGQWYFPAGFRACPKKTSDPVDRSFVISGVTYCNSDANVKKDIGFSFDRPTDAKTGPTRNVTMVWFPSDQARSRPDSSAVSQCSTRPGVESAPFNRDF